MRFNRSKQLERRDAVDERAASASLPALAAASEPLIDEDTRSLIRELHSRGWAVVPDCAWESIVGGLQHRVDDHEIRIGELETLVDDHEVRVNTLEARAEKAEMWLERSQSDLRKAIPLLKELAPLAGESLPECVQTIIELYGELRDLRVEANRAEQHASILAGAIVNVPDALPIGFGEEDD